MRMKRIIVAALMLSMIMCGIFGISVSAESYYESNKAKIEQANNDLVAFMNDHNNSYVDAAVNPYCIEILDLRTPDIEDSMNTKDLTETINLLYKKGIMSGECAVVLYECSAGLEGSNLDAIKSVYNEKLNAIRGNTSLSDLTDKQTNSFYTLDLMKTIYKKKIDTLYSSTDSQDVVMIAHSHKNTVDGLQSPDKAKFEEIYTKAKNDIEIQRIRESAQASFEVFYNKIYGDDAFSQNIKTDENILSFLLNIKSSDSTVKFNSDIKNAALSVFDTLFEGREGSYSQALLAALRTEVEQVVSDADAAGVIATDWSLCDRVALDMSIALAKDSLIAYVAESGGTGVSGVDALVAEYNAVGAIFDVCANTKDAELELGKAKLRVDLLLYLRAAEQKTADIYGTYDPSTALGKLTQTYTDYDPVIKDKAALISAREALNEAKEAIDALISDFEVEVFRLKYGEIIAKDDSELSIADKNLLRAAILEYGSLAATSKTELADDIAEIVRKYKLVCADEIEALGISSEIKSEAAADYSALISALNFGSYPTPEEFLRDADNIKKKAEAAIALCDAYDVIVGSPEYSSYDPIYKSEIDANLDKYLAKVYNTDTAASDIDTLLSEILENGNTELCRSDRQGYVDSLRKADDADDTKQIIADAIAAIETAAGISEIEAIAAEAELEVNRLRAAYALSDMLNQNKKDVEDKLTYLSDPTIYTNDMDGEYDAAVNLLSSAADIAAIDQVLRDAEAALADIYADAEAANLAAAIVANKEKIEAAEQAAKSDIDDMTYLTPTQATEYKGLISDKAAADASAVLAMSDIAEIEALADAYLEYVQGVCNTASAVNLENARTELKSDAEGLLNELENKINSLPYITDEDAEAILSEAQSAHEVFKTAADSAQTVEKLEEQYGIYESVINQAKTDADAADEEAEAALTAVKNNAKSELADKVTEAEELLDSLEYLTQAEKDAVKREIEEALAQAESDIDSKYTIAEVQRVLNDANASVAESMNDAAGTNLENARKAIGDELDEKFGEYSSEDYSDDNYDIILDAYNDAKTAIKNGNSVKDFASAKDGALKTMGSVESKFTTAKNDAERKLTEAYRALIKRSENYSDENLSKINDIYNHTLEELKQLDKSLGSDAPAAVVDERIALMRAVRLDWVSLGDIDIDSSNETKYPDGYNAEKDKVWGIVSGSEGLHFDTELDISNKGILKYHKKTFKDAVKNSLITYIGNGNMSADELKDILGDADIRAVYDIKLTRGGETLSSFNGVYTVRILLPEDLRDIDGLKVVYISDDGKAEYYDAVRDGAFLVFDTEHFSEFFLVSEKSVNLIPLIIILGVLAMIEGAGAVVLTLMIRKDDKAEKLSAIAPVSLLTIIRPKGGVAMLITLAIVDLALGVYIAICIFAILKDRGAEEAEEETPLDLEEPVEEEHFEEEFKMIFPEPMEEVSAEEADLLLPDSSIDEILVSADSPEIVKGKKALINVDTLSENFEPGDLVTLGELKKKNLVPKNTVYLKVLARGVINKPLEVKAQSFSSNAVKMLALTGGSATIESNIEYINL